MPKNGKHLIRALIALGSCLAVISSACAADPPQARRTLARVEPAPTPTSSNRVLAAASAAPTASASGSADPGSAFDPPAELRLPSSLASGERVPLLLVLHGFGVSSSLLIAKAGLDRIADAKKFAYLAPEGMRDSRGRTFWNAGPSCCDLERQAPDDAKRLRQLLDFSLKNAAIDTQRVFVIGYSNGGFMAERLACDLSDRLAGIISVAAAATGPEVACTPSTPLSVLEIHGDADPIVHYQGGTVFDRADQAPHASAPDSAKIWARRLGCSGDPTNVGNADLEPYIAGSETEMQRFEGCRGALELWTVRGGGHYVALQPPALEAMWAFIVAHPKAL